MKLIEIVVNEKTAADYDVKTDDRPCNGVLFLIPLLVYPLADNAGEEDDEKTQYCSDCTPVFHQCTHNLVLTRIRSPFKP